MFKKYERVTTAETWSGLGEFLLNYFTVEREFDFVDTIHALDDMYDSFNEIPLYCDGGVYIVYDDDCDNIYFTIKEPEYIGSKGICIRVYWDDESELFFIDKYNKKG